MLMRLMTFQGYDSSWRSSDIFEYVIEQMALYTFAYKTYKSDVL